MRSQDLPRIETEFELADWLALAPGDLEWFADLRGLNARAAAGSALGHYRYTVLPKRGGSGGVRLIEAPKRTLKLLQRQILHKLLDRVPAHPAVHGFVRGRSIRTFVAPHVGKRLVLRVDIASFFPSIPRVRVQALFRTFGYPRRVAQLLGGLCTTIVPSSVWRGLADPLHGVPHVPQGAPTSPAVANACAWHLDCRLSALAEACDASYSRYADDLAFSGGDEFARSAERFATIAAAIALDEGFQVNHRKTRAMRQSTRQHLAGLVANQRVNVGRREFDALKATLTNCLRRGLDAENRKGHPAFLAHLNGRVGFFESINPEKARRLRVLLEAVAAADNNLPRTP